MASDSKRPGSRLAIAVIVLLAVSAAVIAMWRVSTTSTIQEAPYFPPGHIQIASNQQSTNPSENTSSGDGAATGQAASGSAAPQTSAGASPPQVDPSSTMEKQSATMQPVASSAQQVPAAPAAVPSQPASPDPLLAQANKATETPKPPSPPPPANSVENSAKVGLEPSLSDVRESVEQWRLSWESRQAASYVEFYHPRFPGLTAFARQKNSVMGRAEFIEVKVSELKLSLEPGFTKAQFRQHYKSNTYESIDLKTQHWVMTNSGPRIIEETIRNLNR